MAKAHIENLEKDIEQLLEKIPEDDRAQYMLTQIKLFKSIVKHHNLRNNCFKMKEIFKNLEDISKEMGD